MENEENINDKDIRGFDLQVDNFKQQLISLINQSNMPSVIIYYVLKDLFLESESLYNNTVGKQYTDFCEKAKQEVKVEEKGESNGR